MRMMVWLTKNWSLLLVLFFGLTPLIWYKEGLVIAAGDNYYLLNPGNLSGDFLYAWMERINLGVPNLQTSQLFPLASFWVFFSHLGLSLVDIERLWSVLIFSLTGVFMYFLFLTFHVLFVGKTDNAGRWGALVAATLYMYNPWVATDVITPVARLVGALTPLFLLLWVRGLTQAKRTLKYPFLLGFSSLFLVSSYAQPVSAVAIPLSFFVFLIFFVLDTRRFSHALKFSFLSLFFYLVFNAWWFLPYLGSGLNLFSAVEAQVKGYNFLWATPIFEAFRFMGFWGFRGWDSVKKLAHVPYAHFYYEPPFLLLGYAVAALALAALLLRPRDKRVIYFVFLGLLGVFLAKGATLPLGVIYNFLFEKIPGFSVFREPFARFTGISVLSFSVLLGISVAHLFTLSQDYLKGKGSVIQRWARALWPGVLLLIVLLLSFPLLTGKVIQDYSWHRNIYEAMRVAPPPYWQELQLWLRENNPQARLMVFPRQPYVTCYRWSSGICAAGPLAAVFLSNPLVLYPEVSYYHGDSLLKRFYELLSAEPGGDLAPLFNFFGVGYVLVQNDILWELHEKDIYRPEVLKKVMANQKHLTLKRSFGALDLYEYSRGEKVHPFSLLENFVSIEGSEKTFLETRLVEGESDPARASLFSKQSYLPERTVWDKAATAYVAFVKEQEAPGYQKYSLTTARDGVYTLFGQAEGVDADFPRDRLLRLDGLPVGESPGGLATEPWLNLGNYSLSRGQHSLEFFYQPPANLTAPNGLFNVSWVSGVEARRMEEKVPAGEGGFWVLPSYPRSRVSLVPLTAIRPGGLYRVSFWYKTVGSGVSNFGVQQSSCFLPLGQGEFDSRNLFREGCRNFYLTPGLLAAPHWRFFETTFEANPLSRSALLFFEVDNPEAGAYVSSFKVERVFNASFLARRSGEGVLTDGEKAVGDLTYRKWNPAKYEVALPRTQPLSYEFIFNQSYSENWKAYILATKKGSWRWPLETFFLEPLPREQHFLVNGYANGWQVKERDVRGLDSNYVIIVEYQPQRLYLVGLLLLLGGLSFGFCCFIHKWRSNRQWRTKI